MGSEKRLFVIRQRINGWYVVDFDVDVRSLECRVQKSLQRDHGGLWVGEWNNARTVSEAVLRRKYRIDPDRAADEIIRGRRAEAELRFEQSGS